MTSRHVGNVQGGGGTCECPMSNGGACQCFGGRMTSRHAGNVQGGCLSNFAEG